MANQATAKKGEEFVTTKDEIIFDRIKEQWEGLSGEKQAANVMGIPSNSASLKESDKIINLLECKANKIVRDEIDSVSKKITSDPERQRIVRETMENIIQGRDLKTENELISEISMAANGSDNEETVADKIAAKEALEEMKKAEKENQEEFRQYRITKYVDGYVKQARAENKNLTSEQENLLREQATEIAGVMYSNGNIGNQGMMVSATFNSQSRGKVQNEFGNLRGTIGFMTARKKPRDIIKDSNKREEELKLGGVKIPSNYEKDAFDRARFLLGKNTRLLRRVSSIQEGGSFLVRLKMTFYNFASGWRQGGGLIQTEGGYLSRIGRQSANDFVPGAMGLFLQNGFDTGFGEMVKGVFGSGVRNFAGDAALKLAGGPAGLAASKVLGFLKKFFGNSGSKLGIGVKTGLGSAFDKGGSMLGKAAMGLGALLASIGGLGIGTAVASTMGTTVGIGAASWYTYQQYIVPGDMISALPNAKRECKSRMDWMLNVKKPAIPCGDMTEYNNIIKQKIEEVGYQTRCAVVEAAQYLALDFPYYISYKWGGYYYGDGVSENWCGSGNGMDCNSFIVWAFRQGGFAMKKYGRSELWQGFTSDSDYKTQVFETEKIAFNEANCARIKEIAKPGDIIKTPGVHAALVIGFDGTKLAIAQEGGNGLGLNVCYLNPCTGSGRGFEHRCGKFEEYWSMDKFYEYYVEGTSINGFSIKPNSEVRNLPKE